MAEYNVIGTSLAKVDAPERVTGKAAYGADLDLPGVLWAKLVRSPHAHARITSVDMSAAAESPGVIATLTGAEIQEQELSGPIPSVMNGLSDDTFYFDRADHLFNSHEIILVQLPILGQSLSQCLLRRHEKLLFTVYGEAEADIGIKNSKPRHKFGYLNGLAGRTF